MASHFLMGTSFLTGQRDYFSTWHVLLDELSMQMDNSYVFFLCVLLMCSQSCSFRNEVGQCVSSEDV